VQNGPLVVKDLTTGVTRVLANANGALTPRWSPDGQWIAFTRGAFGDLMIIRPDGTELTRIGTTPVHAGLTWSPDSKWILARGGTGATLGDVATQNMLVLTGVNFGEYPGWKR
jgi:Tol biopolymer transport system component